MNVGAGDVCRVATRQLHDRIHSSLLESMAWPASDGGAAARGTPGLDKGAGDVCRVATCQLAHGMTLRLLGKGLSGGRLRTEPRQRGERRERTRALATSGASPRAS
jgi:hypothetical protein